jgi:hypothetical protein
MCCLENQIRGTSSGQQFRARKRQLASTNALHARMQCSGGPQRKAKIRENAGTTGGRRQNAAASKSARSPSLRLPQPRVPPASACRGRRAPTAARVRLTQGAPQKMRRQDAATQEPTNQVFGGDAHGLSLPQARSTQPRRAALALSLHDNFSSFLVFKVFSYQFKFRALQPEFHQHLHLTARITARISSTSPAT